MPKDRSRKLSRYLDNNDLSKLRSYSSKHDISLPVVSLAGDNTLLHRAAQLGSVRIVRYLLKKGCDPDLLNVHGDLPLHLAVKYALTASDKSAYADLVLPLVKRSPGSLDVQNAAGDTCRQLLQHFTTARMKTSALSDSESSDSDSETDDRGQHQPAETTDRWQQRLAEELADEQSEQWGNYEHDFAERDHEADDWAERIRRAHYLRSQTHYTTRPGPIPSQHHKRPKQPDPGDHLPKRPRISEAKRKAFEENIRKEALRVQAEKAKRVKDIYASQRKSYEVLCEGLFGEATAKKNQASGFKDRKMHSMDVLQNRLPPLKDHAVKLGFRDIPWPQTNGSSRFNLESEGITDFLFGGIEKGTEEYIKAVKMQQRRWHPDRFLQKCGVRLKDKERDKIVEKVTLLSQILNKLTEQIK